MIDGATVALLVRMVVSLAVVLALVVFVARYVERRGVGTARQGRRAARGARRPVDVDVLARAHLARGVSVQVVRVGDHVLALGVTESSVKVLTDLDPADLEGDGALLVADGAPRQASASRDVLEQFLRREGRHRVTPRDHAQG